jgi:hypothetical protein
MRDSGFPVAGFRLLASRCSLASPAAGAAARRHPIPELVEVVCQLPFKLLYRLIVYSVEPRFAFIRLQASETKFWNAHDFALLKRTHAIFGHRYAKHSTLSRFVPIRNPVLSHRQRPIGVLFQLSLQPIQLLVPVALRKPTESAHLRLHYPGLPSPSPGHRQVFRLYTLSVNEWTFLIQSTSLLRRERTGFSLRELLHPPSSLLIWCPFSS